MDNIDIRAAADQDLDAVAALRWQWALEIEHTPAITREEFRCLFVEWARANASTHHCMVIARGGTILGMAWLATLPRVPTPEAAVRATGDMQCVYVAPQERNAGLGSEIIDAVLRRARELGLERVTIQNSDERAVSAYSRLGFSPSPRLLQAEVSSLS